MKEYRVVYKYKEYTLEAGQNGWIPSKEIAEKILKHHQNRPFFRDDKLFIEEREVKDRELPGCREHEGKVVYSRDALYFDALEIGDLVEEEVVDDMINCLPPACMRSDCSQCGEPHSHRIDEDGKGRTTYTTFKKSADKTWEYCGDCFRGENVQRGTSPAYL